MTTIQDLIHEPSSCKFSLKYKVGTYCKTNSFFLNDQWDKCRLTFFFRSPDYGTKDDEFIAKFILEFEGKSSFDQNQNLELIAYFNRYKHGYAFTLNKVNDTTFESETVNIYSQTIYYTLIYTLYIKVNFSNSDFDLEKQKLNDIILNGTHADVKLSVDDKIFHVHKIILFSKNEVFAKMIEDMHEKKIDTISLPGWDSDAVEDLLKYIYTGKCDVTKNPCQLFKMAHFLQISKLQQLCQNYLISNIRVGNLIDILELTKQSQYGLGDLDIAVKKFIRENEMVLAKDIDFVKYLNDSLNLNNITFILKFSNKYCIKNLLSTALDYVSNNYKQVFQIQECKEFFDLNSVLLSKVLTNKHNKFCNLETNK